MLHSFLTSILAVLLAAPVATDETAKKQDPKSSDSTAEKKPSDEKPGKELPKPPRRVGRPGDLSIEEEEKLDKMLNDFILHDIGEVPNYRTVVALRNMGPEAIPALIRALNRSAMMRDSCPVSMFHTKLTYLLSTSNDEEVLRLARASIGVGVRGSRYERLLANLRVVTSQREAQLARLRIAKEKGEKAGSEKGSSSNSKSRYSKDK
jgi:hypothetical protein